MEERGLADCLDVGIEEEGTFGTPGFWDMTFTETGNTRGGMAFWER